MMKMTIAMLALRLAINLMDVAIRLGREKMCWTRPNKPGKMCAKKTVQ